MDSQGLFTVLNVAPINDDWCMRGMEWVSRKVFERGYWKSGADRPEIKVLDSHEIDQSTDGQIEDDRKEEKKGQHYYGVKLGGLYNASSILRNKGWRVSPEEMKMKHWIRIMRRTREWQVEGKLADKVAAWREMERMEREEEEKRRLGKRWLDDDELMGVDAEGKEEESSEEDENDTGDSRVEGSSTLSMESAVDNFPELNIVPGYSTLVAGTNILLSLLSMVSSLMESLHWTVIIPLPVIMELNGLINNPSQLGQAAKAAMDYATSNIRTYSMSLKVQTSKGNYLAMLNVKTEEVDFTSGNVERSMDDLMLKVAIWQDERWLDRSAILGVTGQNTNGAVKVVLLSLNCNLCLKVRSRQLPAAGEKDLAALLANHT
ncbi:hypothetical protein NP233_g11289 [Leucocoprinus birnbaumii]|uniref:PIN domain-containing protein n=1 Tax=Leucocoprinus birnbaumii TaxID=56174 RepID=A0AAD5VH86_9AGAR|nr:hypothetical protein NP233_g11289 [Leucocoprinus birnbaumii]